MKKVYEYQTQEDPVFYSTPKKAYEAVIELEPEFLLTYKQFIRRLYLGGFVTVNSEIGTQVIRRYVL